MQKKLGIDNIISVMRFASVSASAGSRVYADGKISFGDIKDLWDIGVAAQELAKIDFQQIFPEVKDLSREELYTITQSLCDGVKLPNKVAEAQVQGYILRAKGVYDAIAELVNFHQVEGFASKAGKK